MLALVFSSVEIEATPNHSLILLSYTRSRTFQFIANIRIVTESWEHRAQKASAWHR